MDCKYRAYNSSIPAFLKDRPKDVVNHIFPTRYLTDLTEANIETVSPGHYKVKSETSPYLVFFSDDESPPSCTCSDWERFHLPCKHFCVFFDALKMLVGGVSD